MFGILFTIFNLFISINSHDLLGSNNNVHNCVLDDGYQWCESTQMCQRFWEIPCTDFVTNECRNGCPPPIYCPIPPSNCEYKDNSFDKCGCKVSCGTIRCTPDISNEGQVCGGYVPYNIEHYCNNGLECVNRMGPFISDAPGTCELPCEYLRDYWGNCIDLGCKEWFDGCNTCIIEDDDRYVCSDLVCYGITDTSHCTDNEKSSITQNIPGNCISWFDGCNTCSIKKKAPQVCTLMMCFTNDYEPHCRIVTKDNLIKDDLCYQFCNGNVHGRIDRRLECPIGTTCSPRIVSTGLSDSCGERAHFCNSINGH